MKFDAKGCFVKQPDEERFWDKVQKTETCWLWIGAKNHSGYGVLHRSGEHRKRIRAHRLSWKMHYGPIPEGLTVCHKCDNPPCIRPDHLFLGTKADNLKDMRTKRRHAFGEKNGMAKLTKEQIAEIRNAHVRLGRGRHNKIPANQVVGSAAYLAKKFGVVRQQIERIVNGDRWAN